MREVEITIMELLDSYPKAYSIILEYFTNMMIESFNDEVVPEEFKQAMRETGISKERLALIIGAAPRCLFSPFDEQEVYIEIYRSSGDGFTYTIDGYETQHQSFKTRIECELTAIKDAFKILEEKS